MNDGRESRMKRAGAIARAEAAMTTEWGNEGLEGGRQRDLRCPDGSL